MPLYSKESLENIRTRVDLLDVITSHVDLKRTGASYKGLCPFHDEKTPSFIVQKGDTHYHCFGCGAHGDAIGFLMNHLNMGFMEAVETLADRFGVHLEKVDDDQERGSGISRSKLKEANNEACRFFQFCLLHTKDGQIALNYLYDRGFSLEFIKDFQVGYSPTEKNLFRQYMYEKGYSDKILESVGLIKTGNRFPFFSERIMFPIHDPAGFVIGFSARKYKEETFGGKYINSPDTDLFKKSKILYGLNYSRRRIVKEGMVIVVEGQIDALKLIDAGFNCTVASLGTAFGQSHVSALIKLGVSRVFLALDSDAAGFEASVKVGHLFQKEGLEVLTIKFPSGLDPDAYIRKWGTKCFQELIEKAPSYLEFLINYRSRGINVNDPAGKNRLVQILSKQIREWKERVMVHESLRKLAHMTDTPEEMLDIGHDYTPNIYVKKTASVGLSTIDPKLIQEQDFLRWLILLGAKDKNAITLAKENIEPKALSNPSIIRIYETYLAKSERSESLDLISLITQEEDQQMIDEIFKKRVKINLGVEGLEEAIKNILYRNWMEERENIRVKIQSGKFSDEEADFLMKKFNDLQKSPPQVK